MTAGIRSFLELPILKIKDFEITLFDVLVVVIIFTISRLIVWSSQKFLQRNVFRRSTIDEGRQFTLLQLIKYFVYVIATLLAFQALGVELSLLLAGSAALLVGIGLGLQQTFKDLVAGLILLFEGNVTVGDIIEINALIGRVTAIGLRTSKIETRDAITIIVPNSRFLEDNVVNWSHNKKLTRFTIAISVSYDSDPDLVKKILLECVKAHRDVVEKPGPFVRLQNFGDNGVHFELLFWTYNVWRIENLKSDIRYSIFRAFKENRITIPFPQRDVHVRSISKDFSSENAFRNLSEE
jgi:small-conductance mechanosensitive channel